MHILNWHQRFRVNLLLVTAWALFAQLAYSADVVSSFKVGAGVWSLGSNWTNTPFLGGFPNNGNAGVATYDAIVSSGTVTLDTNIVVQKFKQSGGTVTGGFNLTPNDLHTWTGGTLSGTGTNFDNGGLAISGTVSLSARRLEPMISATLTGGSLHMGTGAVLTNQPGVTFSFLDDSTIFSDGGAPLLLNQGTIDKTGAGNGVSGVGVGVSRIDVPFFNHGTARASAGTLQIAGGGITGSSLDVAAGARVLLSGDYTLDGATWSGAGTGQVSSATTTLTNDVSVTVSTFVHSGGTIGGPGNLIGSGAYNWTAGTESGSGTNRLSGPLAIAGTVTLTTRRLEPVLSATLAGGSLHMGTGAVLTNQPGVTFSFLDDSTIFNDGAAPAFLNQGTVDKTGAGNGVSGVGVGVSRIDVPFFNHGTAHASAGTLQIAGGGITGSTLDAAAGARILLSSDYTLNGATWSGAGTGQVSSATTTLTNDVSVTVSTFVHSGGTIGGPGNLIGSGAYNWTAGTESGSGTNRLSGPLAIAGTVTLTTRRLEPVLSATLAGGSLHMGTGAVLTNQPGVTFSFLDDSTIFNDGAAPAFLNQGTVDKTGAGNGVSGVGVGVSRIDVPFFNHGTAHASTGTLQIAGGGITGSTLDAAAGARILLSSDYTLNGATWSGAGTGQVSSATTTLTNDVSVTVSTFVHSGGTIGGPGNLIGSGAFNWTAGTESGSGTNRLSGPLAIKGTVTLSTRRLNPLLSATLAGGSLHMGSGAVVENPSPSSFNFLDDSTVFNDGLSPSFINLGILLKSGSGNGVSGVGLGVSRVDVPLTNSGTVSAQSGTLSFTASYVQTAGFTLLTGGVISASSPLDIQGGSVIGTGTLLASLTNNGTISPGFSPGILHISGTLTCKSNSNLKIELSGTTPGTEYDQIDVTNAVVLAGTLQVWLINGFQSTIPAGAVFTVLKAGSSLTGGLSNVASGQRLNTADGFGSFLVTYDNATKTVVLSDFIPAAVIAADFSASPTSGQAPLMVTFVNLTSGAASSYLWSFGDGAISAAANPAHTYTNPGTYTVSLTASTPGVTNTITKTNLITVTAPCPAPGTFTDDFTPGLRPTYWRTTQDTPGLFSVDDTHGDVRLAKTAMASPGGVQQVAIRLDTNALGGSIGGDFSTQVDFRKAVVPGPGVDQIELHVHFSDGSIFFLVYDNSSGTNVHVWTGSINGLTPVATNAGTFTISRTGTTLTGYFNGSPIFSEVNASTLTAIEFVLQLQPGSNDSTSVAFDNFSLVAPSVPLQTPTITCPTNQVLSTSAGLCARTNITYAVTFNDICPGAELTQIAGLPSGSTFPKGTTTNTFVLSDASSNTVQCSFTITVNDAEPPTITCPADIVLLTDPDQCTKSNVTFAATVTDNCPGVTVACIPPSGSTFSKGVTIVHCVATDTSGNTNTCSFTVTVNDTLPPKITCPADIVANAAAGSNSVVVNFPAPAVSDNCPGVTASCAPPSGSAFPLGPTKVTCVATDAAGNTNSCSFTITVNASATNTPPTIACPSDITTNNAPGTWGRTLAFLPVVTGSPTPTVTSKLGPTVITSPYSFPVGTNIVSCTASNLAGIANCAFTVIVNDTEPPVLSCSTNVAAVAAAGELGTVVNFVVAAIDSCDGPVPVICTPSHGYFAIGQTLVTCVAVDRSSNRAICNFTVTVTAAADRGRTCSFTQGFYGNSKGRFNGIPSLVLVGQLLGQGPLVVGKTGVHSLSILPDDAALLEQRLPSGGPPAALPNKGDQTLKTAQLPLNKKGRFADVLIGQTITLALNVRLSPGLSSFGLTASFCSQGVLAGPDGLKGTADDLLIADDIQSFGIPASMLNALSDPALVIDDVTVQGLLKLANCALAGLPTGAATLADITAALDAINRSFDGCRIPVDCALGPIRVDAFNDAFNARPVLDPPPPPDPLVNVRFRSSNLAATSEPGEPVIAGNPGGKSVWWRWPAPASGPVAVSTIGSSFDTLLAVYSGTALSNLVLLASNDDAEGTLQSDVTFQAVAGTEYQIAVDGFDGESGAIVLTLVSAPPQLCEPLTVNGTQVQLCLTGELGRAYTVEAASDLPYWTVLSTILNTNGVIEFTDPAMSNFHRRFYRVTFEP